MRMLILAALSLLRLAIPSAAQAAQAFTPAAIPIAARSPYLLNFLPTNPSTKDSRIWQTGYSTQARLLYFSVPFTR